MPIKSLIHMNLVIFLKLSASATTLYTLNAVYSIMFLFRYLTKFPARRLCKKITRSLDSRNVSCRNYK